jgi:hypothetical protein
MNTGGTRFPHENWNSSIKKAILGTTLVAIALVSGAGSSLGQVDDHPVDKHPVQDIPDDKGLFIESGDGFKILRLYGSVRFRTIYDNKQNFHAYDLNIPQVPTGEEDVLDYNSEWTIGETQLGADVYLVKPGLRMKVEVDFKGTTEKFRVRHAYLRSKHWLFGQAWSTFNTVPFLVLSVDGHGAGNGVGVRPPQIRYSNSAGKLQYRLSLEYYRPKLIVPDSVDARSRDLIPNLAGNVTGENGWVHWRVAGLLNPNRVQFTTDAEETQTLLGYSFQIGAKFTIDESNRIKTNAGRAVGSLVYYADFAYTDSDLVYNPTSGEFESVVLPFGVQVGYEHNWTKSLSTTVAGSYMDVSTKDFEDDLAFNDGYKALVNLFYKPVDKYEGLAIGGEVVFAGRTNKDLSKSNTARVAVLIYYNY